jgi:DNA-binding NtrC family response regulator
MNNSSRAILIVDDRPNWRNLLRTVFLHSEIGYSVETADDVEQANNMLHEHQFSLVITNLGLDPARGRYDRSGLEVIDKLQEMFPGTPCIVFTAFDDATREQVENYCARYDASIRVMWKWDTNVYKDLTNTARSVLGGVSV